MPGPPPWVPQVPTDGKKANCGCGCGCANCHPLIPPGTPPPQHVASPLPIHYGTGEIILTAEDLHSDGYGTPWGHTRSYANRLTNNTDVGSGVNWQVAQWPYLVIQDSGTVVVMGKANDVLWFDPAGGGYTPRFSARQTLLLDAGNNVYELVDLDGSVSTFSAANGVFQSHRDAAGNLTVVTGYLPDGYHIAQVERTVSVGGNTTVEQYVYAYTTPIGLPPQLVNTVILRSVNGGPFSNVNQVQNSYYSAGDLHGGPGDLQLVTAQTWDGTQWQTTGTTYYRYYLQLPGSSSSSSSSGSSGTADTVHLLKYVVNPASYDLLSAAVGNPLTATDAQVAQYADFYFEYDSNRRVTLESVEGGTRTITFSYAQSSNANGYNSWQWKTTETRPDGSQNVVYSNYAGQTMLMVLQSGSDQWPTFYQYDNNSADPLMVATPSAVSGYDDTYADLLHKVAGNYQYLRDNSGLLHIYQYHGPTGYLTAEYVQQGELGVPVIVHFWEYIAHYPTSSSSSSSSGPSSSSSSSSGGPTRPPVYFLAKKIDYPDDPTAPPLNSSSSSSSSPGPGRQIITTYAYTWYPGTCAKQQVTTTLPVISSAQNGSGVSATLRDYFDTYGNKTWHMDERGFITNTSYDIPTGAISQRIDDVDTTQVTAPAGWTTPTGGGLHLITDFTFDEEGRTTQTLGPSHTIDLNGTATTIRRAAWMIYQDAIQQVWTGQGYATGSSPSYSYTLINPVMISATDKAGRPIAVIQATRSSTSGALLPTDSFPQSSYVRWTTMQYADGFHLSSQRVYKLIPSTGNGSSGTNYDETDFGYDVMMRQNRQVTPGGTITRIVFDVRDNPAQTWVGTDDNGASDNDPSGGGAPGNNMVQISLNQYDGGMVGGDNNLTTQTVYVDATTTRVTTFLLDWRDRQTDIDGEVDLYQKVYYDNLDRKLRTERYDTTLSGNLVARSDTLYDDLNRVYQSIRYGVDPTTGVVGYALTDNNWFDAAGNLLKSLPAGSQLFTKLVYDSLGRTVVQYSGYNLTDSSYANASSVTTDTIIEQVETSFDNASNVIQVTTRQRYHNATGTGGLLGPTGSQPQARLTYAASWQDGLGRVVATADYGTNGGTSLSRPNTIPARSDTVLVSSTVYDNTGSVQTTTDPMGTVTCFTYDNAGRQVQRILNCQMGSSSSSSSGSSASASSSSGSSGSSSSSGGCAASDDTNVTELLAYNADGNVSQITAVNARTGNQVTQYVYGSTQATSDIASSLLRVAEIYPDSVSGSDQVKFTYNRQGQVITKTDQNGTVHSYDLDGLGRITQDCVTTVGIGVDSTVLRIATSYEVRGMVSGITSFDNATVGSGNVVNDVLLSFDQFRNLTSDYQSHSGAVNTSTTPVCQYGHANGSANTVRLTSVTYPNGRVLNCNYGSAGGINDALSRIGSLIDDDSTTHLADYSFLGLGMVVEVSSTQPSLMYTLVGTQGGIDPVTGDIYRGLDQFARIKDLLWYNTATSATIEEVLHGYDRSGDRLWRADLADTARLHDELYGYDGLYRLTAMYRGTLNGTATALTTNTFGQCWTLDSTGNWAGFRQDSTGSGSWNLIQSRLANPVNELIGITNSAGSAWASAAYDLAGNMTTLPQPGALGQSYSAVYDSWNRLVKFSAAGTEVAYYQYDGFNRRGVKQVYSGGILSQTRHLFYSVGWQVLEERVGTAIEPQRQFVWGLRYGDDLVLRDRDTTGGGTLDERLYSVQDANWNVTGVVDPTGLVQERYGYDAYGAPSTLTSTFGSRVGSNYDWEILYSGYRWDSEVGLYQVRHRVLHSLLGWLQREPTPFIWALGQALPTAVNVYSYTMDRPLIFTDGLGLFAPSTATKPVTIGVTTGTPTTTGVAGAAGLTAGQIAAILASAALACFGIGRIFCDSEIQKCFAQAVTFASQCAALACVPKGFKTRSGRFTCTNRYFTRFQNNCISEILECYVSCGLTRIDPPFRCKSNVCDDLCNDDESPCHHDLGCAPLGRTCIATPLCPRKQCACEDVAELNQPVKCQCIEKG